jgi:dihydrofolate reductase
MSTVYYTATSLDGFIADRAGSLEWLLQFESSPGKQDRFGRFFATVGAMALGSTTYEWVVQHERLLDKPSRWQGYYGDVPSWVFTTRELPVVPGAAINFVQGDVAQVHGGLVAAAGGKDVWVIGGGDLAGQFLDAGLLDRILVGVAPLTLGGGAPLLPRAIAQPFSLSHVEHDGEFVFLDYEVRRQPASAGGHGVDQAGWST